MKMLKILVVAFELSLLCIGIVPTNASTSSNPSAHGPFGIGIASHKREYGDPECQEVLSYDDAQSFIFQRFQSPRRIREALSHCHTKGKLKRMNRLKVHSTGTKTNPGAKNSAPVRKKSFKWFKGKDGRRGYVSSTKLGGDWVLAESEQVAVQARTEEVLEAYLTGKLQQKWNTKEILDCTFTCIDDDYDDVDDKAENVNMNINSDRKYPYYRQDLVLRSQRVITSHTGIMRYSQIITIDQIGDHDYSVSIRLDPKMQRHASMASTSTTRPFDSLSVHVGLEQDGDNVNIYASGVMKVNRKVVPNLVVFDASGIAGSMAGKGTLWLAAHFEERARTRRQ